MKWIVYGACLIVALGGGVFFLQGMRVLPGRLMYGQPQWIVIGAVMVLASAATAVFVNRRTGVARS